MSIHFDEAVEILLLGKSNNFFVHLFCFCASPTKLRTAVMPKSFESQKIDLIFEIQAKTSKEWEFLSLKNISCFSPSTAKKNILATSSLGTQIPRYIKGKKQCTSYYTYFITMSNLFSAKDLIEVFVATPNDELKA